MKGPPAGSQSIDIWGVDVVYAEGIQFGPQVIDANQKNVLFLTRAGLGVAYSQKTKSNGDDG